MSQEDKSKGTTHDHKQLDYSEPTPLRESVIDVSPIVPAEAARRPAPAQSDQPTDSKKGS